MTRIRTIINGFVDLNLETDENVNTKIISENTIQSSVTPISINPNKASFFRFRGKIELPVTIDEVLTTVGINPASVTIAHVQGSRLYGVEGQESDWDLVIVSNEINTYQFKEASIDGNDFDIHAYHPTKFQEHLDYHNMRELESIYHPANFRLTDVIEFNTTIDVNRLISTVKYESDSLWNIAKSMLDNGADPYPALKRYWHSFRFLIFAKQILDEGSITDFSEANYLYDSIVGSKRVDSAYFEATFSQTREDMKTELDTYIQTR